jgi:predicted HTH transcriptional regulator
MKSNEDANIEYKRELTNKLKREIVSFLNSSTGGVIYLGVDDETHQNFDISQSARHQWEETITNWSTGAFYPVPYSLIDVLPNDAVFTIKVRPGRHKPYAIAANGFDSSGVYVRQGSSAVKATNERIRRMQQQYRMSGEFDSEQSAEQLLTFKGAQEVFEGLSLPFDQNALRLVNENVYNNSALLISDQNPFEVRVATYDGTDVMTFRDKRRFYGPITKQIDDVLAYLDLANHRQATITGKAQRTERQDYPTVAIREAVVNAFVHRDYLLHSSVKVELFDDRLEIVSPGGIPDGLTLEEIEDGLTAVRNPTLIHILDKMNYIENYGTGIRRMYRAYRDSTKTLTFEVRENSFKVILPNQNYRVSDDVQDDNQSSRRVVPSNQALILETLKQAKEPLRRTEIQNRTKLSRDQSVYALRQLVKSQKIETVGISVNTKYRIRE